MPTVAFIGKHSKDRVLSIYLPKRVYVDEGEGIEPIQAIARLHARRAQSIAPHQGTVRHKAHHAAQRYGLTPCGRGCPRSDVGGSRVHLAGVRVCVRALRL